MTNERRTGRRRESKGETKKGGTERKRKWSAKEGVEKESERKWRSQ